MSVQYIPTCVPTIYVLSKNKKNIKSFLLNFFKFYNLKNCFILHGQVFVMNMNYYACFVVTMLGCAVFGLWNTGNTELAGELMALHRFIKSGIPVTDA